MSLQLALFFLIVSSNDIGAEPHFDFIDSVLTIKTDRYEVEWQNGSAKSIVTLLPVREELTLDSQPMQVNQLPSGLGSFFLQEKAGNVQHGPVATIKLPVAFPAQHPPSDDSEVSCLKVKNGVELTYRNLQNAPGDIFRQRLSVAPATGDLIVRQDGISQNPGVFGLSFSMLNLKPDLELIVPFFAGEKWGGDRKRGYLRSLAWSSFWSAALIIGEASQGGTFAVWGQDPDMRAKYFYHYNGKDAQGVAFESCMDAPYSGNREATSIEWRFNTFPGSWQIPAKRYKEWMVSAHGLVQRTQRTAAWINDLSLFLPNWDFSRENLAAIGKVFDPKHVLLHNWNMLSQFNRKVPEYIPENKRYAALLERARGVGFHVGGYTSMALADVEYHPGIMKKYRLDYNYDGLNSKKPMTPSDWLVSVHPGSMEWGAFYLEKMKMLHEKYGVDLLYQDTSGASTGSAGLIDGKTRDRAVVNIEDNIRKSLPQAALMGEMWNEVNVCREDFALINYLIWFGDEFKNRYALRATVHPILSFLFSDFCLRMAFSSPYRNVRRFHMEENINEVTGALPYWHTSVDDPSGEAELTLIRAGLWAAGFRPYFPEHWEPDTVACMKNPEGDIVRYVADGESTYCYRETKGNKKLLYARVIGKSKLKEGQPVRVASWLAYRQEGPIGLDQNNWYCVFPGEPGALPLKISALPHGAVIKGAHAYDDFTFVAVDGGGEGTIGWQGSQSLILSSSGVPVSSEGAEASIRLPANLIFSSKKGESPDRGLSSERMAYRLPLETWKHVIISNNRNTGQIKIEKKMLGTGGTVIPNAFMVEPPTGGRDVEATIEGLVDIPENLKPVLHAMICKTGEGAGDGVNFVVRVNGTEVWRKLVETSQPEAISVPIPAYYGKTVLLSLGVDCGKAGNNLSNDQSYWADAMISNELVN
ncbi:MAG: DUF6259 domain-containing protein [Pseudomonadota bacterium]